MIGTSAVKFSIGQIIIGALDCIQIFGLINKPSKSCYTGFLALGFSGDIVQKILCPLSYVRYASTNDLYVCVGCRSIYLDVFVE